MMTHFEPPRKPSAVRSFTGWMAGFHPVDVTLQFE